MCAVNILFLIAVCNASFAVFIKKKGTKKLLWCKSNTSILWVEDSSASPGKSVLVCLSDQFYLFIINCIIIHF